MGVWILFWEIRVTKTNLITYRDSEYYRCPYNTAQIYSSTVSRESERGSVRRRRSNFVHVNYPDMTSIMLIQVSNLSWILICSILVNKHKKTSKLCLSKSVAYWRNVTFYTNGSSVLIPFSFYVALMVVISSLETFFFGGISVAWEFSLAIIIQQNPVLL